MDCIIRPMQIWDIDQVATIEKETFSIPWSANSFMDACAEDSNIYLVCEVDGEIAGYCGMWTVFGEGNITNVAVNEKFRGRGYGKALLKELEEYGKKKGVETYFLEVRESNSIARKLYLSLGFREIGIRKNFYEKPVENAIVMSKAKFLA